MDIRTLMSILQPLFSLCTEVMNTNFQFQTLLASRIQQTGKPVEEMTLAEIRQLVDEVTAEYQANQ